MGAKPETVSSQMPSAAERRGGSFASLLFAALVGGAIAAAVIVALLRAGYLLPIEGDNPPDTTSSDIAALQSEVAALKGASDPVAPIKEQIAALEKSVADLASQAPATSPEPAQLKALEDRLAAIENTPPTAVPTANLEPRIAALAQDIAALKNAAPPDTTALQSDVASLHQQLDALSARLEKLPQDDRVAAVESKLAETTTRVDEIGRTTNNAAALAPAVAADALQAALDSGRPFKNELAALKGLGVDAASVDALAQQAQTGLPTVADLRQRFEQAIASVTLEKPIPENTGAIDRLLQSAESLVSIRPAHPVAGSDPGAIVARIRAALDVGDLNSALAEWDALPDAIKASTADWANLAKARLAADGLIAQVRSDALSKLGVGQ
jgi:hypothetical protein